MKNKVFDLYNHTFNHKGFDYDQIDEAVFIGTNMCCQIGFDRELLVKNVKADISLEDDRVDAPQGVDYFLWLPTKDHEAPTPDKLTLGVYALEFFASRGVKVYIHCKHGHGRAPVLFLAYLTKRGMSLDDAMLYLKTRRPGVNLSTAQLEALKAYQASLKPNALASAAPTPPTAS